MTLLSKCFFILAVVFASFLSEAKPAQAKNTITCNESKAQKILVPFGRVVAVNFPASPKEVIPGESGFDFKTIRSDLVIKALRPGARTNLLVYLESRRCLFHLSTQMGASQEIIIVRDSNDKSFEVKFNER